MFLFCKGTFKLVKEICTWVCLSVPERERWLEIASSTDAEGRGLNLPNDLTLTVLAVLFRYLLTTHHPLPAPARPPNPPLTMHNLS